MFVKFMLLVNIILSFTLQSIHRRRNKDRVEIESGV